MEYRGRDGFTAQVRKGNGTVQGRSGGKTAQGRNEGRSTQGGQRKEQEIRQPVNNEKRMYDQYRIVEKGAAVKKKTVLPSGAASLAASTA